MVVWCHGAGAEVRSARSLLRSARSYILVRDTVRSGIADLTYRSLVYQPLPTTQNEQHCNYYRRFPPNEYLR